MSAAHCRGQAKCGSSQTTQWTGRYFMSLAILILGLAVFIGTHLLTTRRETRAALIARFGEGVYKGLYSLVSIIGIVLIGWGFARYRATGWIDVWYPPIWTRH